MQGSRAIVVEHVADLLLGGHLGDRAHSRAGQYTAAAEPVRRAGIVIDNNDLNHPFVRRATDCRGGAVRAD
jgi:hypothetical protein